MPGYAATTDVRAGAPNASAGLLLPADYISKPSGKLHPDLVHPGLQIDERGRRFISDGTVTYAVRFDSDNRTERVYQPDNPAKPGIPVRPKGNGEYELHDDVGLKGGSPGRGLQTRFNIAQGRREAQRRELAEAQRMLNAIENESRQPANSTSSSDVQTRLITARQAVDKYRSAIQDEDWRLENIRRDASQLRQQMQGELSYKRSARQEGVRLEAAAQLDINLLQVTSPASGASISDLENRLRARKDELRRIQDANATLDRSMEQLTRDMNDIPIL